MEMKFTPWRMTYIKGTENPDKTKCVLCDLPQADPPNDPDNLIVFRGTRCYVLMNLYPYNTGHLMVVPYEHTADLAQLNNDASSELFFLTRRCITHLTEEYHPHGFNLGMNLGRVAGAGLDEHLHMHIVPRWNGDTNFMPLLAEMKLIPEDLERTYHRLHPRFANDPEL
jgi:ATP adenylyltransferase